MIHPLPPILEMNTLGRKVDMAGAPIGNKNAQKGGIWNDYLRKAIAQDDGKRLRESIEKLLDLASIGERWAIKELADRLYGRPKQTSVMAGFTEQPIEGIKIVFVSPDGRRAGDIASLKIQL